MARDMVGKDGKVVIDDARMRRGEGILGAGSENSASGDAKRRSVSRCLTRIYGSK